ncbi:MAG: sugar phosphate isomerase/epimerase family protein [Spirochaetaceae bacterium]|nr:sugar phosphate isomerase/epimerase family protein [Spirochaetaceae bacterium]
MAANKLGICEWSLPVEGPYACRLASEIGFEGIQLDVGPYEKGFPKSRSFLQKAYMHMGKEYGIEFPSMAARVSDYYSMVSEPGSREHEIVKSGIAAAIDACGAMSIPRVLIPNFEKSAIRTDRHFDIAVEVIRWACDLASDKGVTILPENTLSENRFRALVKAVDRKNIGLYFDFQNYYLHNDDNTPELLKNVIDLVQETHVKDGRNKDLSGALLGTGAVHFEKSVKVLKDHGYTGWIVSENYYDMEPLCGPSDDPLDLMKKDLDTLKKLFG